MSAKAISEATGKDIINRNLAPLTSAVKCRFASINENTKWEDLLLDNPWLKSEVLILILFFIAIIKYVIIYKLRNNLNIYNVFRV